MPVHTGHTSSPVGGGTTPMGILPKARFPHRGARTRSPDPHPAGGISGPLVAATPMPITYAIKDWDTRWENAATRKLSRTPDYLPMRTDQRSSVFLRLMQTRDGIATYGVFVALVQLAASCQPRRGVLARSGVAYDADTCAGLIGADRRTVRRAWATLIEVGWLTASNSLNATDEAALDATDAAGSVADFRQQVSQQDADDGGNGGGNPPPNPPDPPTVSANAAHGFSSRARNGTVRNGTDTATATARGQDAAAAAVAAKGGKTLSDVRRELMTLGLTPGKRLDAIEASGLSVAAIREVGTQWRAAKGKGTGVLLTMLEARIELEAANAGRKAAVAAGRAWIASASLDELKRDICEYAAEKRMTLTGPSAQAISQTEGFAVWCSERHWPQEGQR